MILVGTSVCRNHGARALAGCVNEVDFTFY